MFCLRTRPHVSDGAFGAEAAQISPPAGAYGAPPYMPPPPHRAVRAVGYLEGHFRRKGLGGTLQWGLVRVQENPVRSPSY